MSELRIIPVVFGGKHFIITDHRMQYDYGQVLDFKDLELPDSFEARFSNAPTGESIGQIGSNNRIRIPKQFFESGEPIYCYITLHDEVTDGRTVYTTKVPIKPSTERTEEEPEPEEESIITQAITALNTAVDTTAQKAQEASASADRAEHAADGIEAYAERAESAQTAAESARDIALEAKVSAHTSAATATEKASEAISSATVASQSAITAENASESAQEYATASAESASASAVSASQANEHASTAGSKAQEASGYASSANTSANTASQKALEASQSASTAVDAKTDAESAKTASQTAQTASESARDGAVTAKADAESARNEAQEIVDGISGKVEQIDSNTERIESLEDDRYKPYPTDTASGSIASFPDGANNIPMESLKVKIEPVQDLSKGDPSPDNICSISGWTGAEVQRTGKNLFGGLPLAEKIASVAYRYTLDTDAKTITFQNAAAKSGNYNRVLFDELKADTQYTVVITYTGVALNESLLVNDTNNNVRKVSLPVASQKTTVVMTTPVGYNAKSFVLSYYANGEVTVFYEESGLFEGVITASEFKPYSGNTYSVDWTDTAGTVYGAYVDVINGELVVDSAQIASYSGETLPSTWISDRDVYTSGTTPTIGAQVVYKLAEPIHYSLTPTEITSLLGTNNLWADTGNIEVEYRADPELYIEKTKPVVNVDDVQIDGTSIVNNGVAGIPFATLEQPGVGRIGADYGITMLSGKRFVISRATSAVIKSGTQNYRPIVSSNQHAAVFYGLAKAAGSDEKDSTLPVGEYTEEAKIAIQKMLGIYEAPWELIEDFTLEEDGGFDKSVEQDGTPYNFRAAYVRITVPPNSTSIESGYGRWYFVDENNTKLNAESGRYIANTAQMCKAILIERNANMALANMNSYVSTGGKGTLSYKNITGISFNYGNIKRIYTNIDDKEPAGARIEIYAQRA